MHIFCPHCRNSIEISKLTPRGEVSCPSCGSMFCLDPGSTVGATSDQGRGFDVTSTLGRFELLGTLGQGAFGTVYKARDPELDRTVAIKVPRAGNLAGPQELDRFLREARSVAQLRHPSIVSVHEVGQLDGLPYLVSDFVEGITLAHLLSTRRPGFRETAELTAAIADALQYAHERGVVHRDVKPSNIMIGDDGKPCVMDFGMAKREAGEVTMTMEGQVLGTPAYMSPEQARGEGHEVDGRSDVYSLGVILYEMLTGMLPFRGTTRMLLQQVLHDDPRPPRSLNDHIPRDLETICLKAMAKEPSRRYATAQELADDLRRWLSGEPIRARPVGRMERLVRWARCRPAVAGLLVVSGVAALALVGLAVGLVYNAELNSAYQSEAAAKEEALTAQQAAEEQRQKAETAFGEAEQARKAEAEAHKKEQIAAAGQERFHYYRRIGLAQAEWEKGNVAHAEQLLDDCPKAHRGWEWHYLKRLCHPEVFTLRGHAEGVAGVAFSPDGKRIASAGIDGTVRLWDAETGKEVRSIRAHAKRANGIAFSPDGKRLASAGAEPGLRVWDAETGKEVHTVEGEAHAVTKAAFSPDGKQLAAVGTDGVVNVWDAAEPRLLYSFKVAVWGFASVSFTPNGKRLIVASNGMYVWDVTTGQLAYLRSRHTGAVNTVAVSPDGGRWAAGGIDLLVRVQGWEPEAGVLALGGHTLPLESMAFSPDGRWLASGGADRAVKIWDLAGGRQERTLRGHTGAVKDVAFSPDGRRLATASADGTVKAWDVTTDPVVLTLRGHNSSILGMAFSHDGTQLASSSAGSFVRFWDLETGLEAGALNSAGPMLHLAYSPDGRRLAGVTAWGITLDKQRSAPDVVQLWDAATRQEVFRKPGQACLAFSADGRLLAAGGKDPKTVTVWNLANGQEDRTLSGPKGSVASVAFSPRGDRLAAGFSDGDGMVWDAATGEEKFRFGGHAGSVLTVAFSPDGTRLVTASLDGTIRVRDAAAGQEVLKIKAHEGMFRVAFSPDGTRLATSGDAGTVTIWDLPTGQEILGLRGQAAACSGVGFSRDGRRLAAGSFDGALMVWDAGPPDGSPPPAGEQALARVALAWHARQANDSELASNWFALAFHARQLISMRPDLPSLHAWRGIALSRLGLQDEGQAELEKALEKKDELGPNYRIEVYGELERWEEAEAAAAQAVRFPHQAHLWYQLALLRAQVGEGKGYPTLCAVMVKRFKNTTDPGIAGLVAHSCTIAPKALEDLGPAAELARRAIAPAPLDATGHDSLGALLYRTGDHKAAVAELNEAVRLSDGNPSAYGCLFLAMAHHGLGQADEAGKWLARAAEIHEKKPGQGWEARLEWQILHREAKQLIRGEPGKPPE